MYTGTVFVLLNFLVQVLSTHGRFCWLSSDPNKTDALERIILPGCREYLVCENNIVQKKKCDLDLFYDPRSKRCTAERSSECRRRRRQINFGKFNGHLSKFPESLFQNPVFQQGNYDFQHENSGFQMGGSNFQSGNFGFQGNSGFQNPSRGYQHNYSKRVAKQSTTYNGVTQTVVTLYLGSDGYRFTVNGHVPDNDLLRWAENNYRNYNPVRVDENGNPVGGQGYWPNTTPSLDYWTTPPSRRRTPTPPPPPPPPTTPSPPKAPTRLPTVTVEFPLDCGVLSKSNDKITEGTLASIESNPWQVALLSKADYSLVCGGSIVTKFHVITAAHCFRRVKSMVVLAGDPNVDIEYRPAPVIETRDIVIHKQYGKDSSGKGNDIAIIVLKFPLKFSPQIRAICLPPNRMSYTVGLQSRISGWGKNEKGVQSQFLQEAYVKIVDNLACHESYEKKKKAVMAGMFCAGDIVNGGADTCQGDSGGPLAADVFGNHKYYLLGVTSWGEGCGLKGYPGVYTKVAMYVDWIKTTLRQSVRKP